MTPIDERREAIETRHRDLSRTIRNVSQDVGRSPEDVTLIAVTKGFGPEAIELARELDLGAVGENRVRNAVEKKNSLSERITGELEWHMIGHVQSNKVKHLLGEFELIHSVDRSSLLEELTKRLSRNDLTQRVLMQVNVSGEESKYGADPDESSRLLTEILESDVLSISGLMTMAPYTDDENVLRETFAGCRKLRDRLEDRFDVELPELSMGMTNDYEAAIREGSTMLRIGRGIFGERPE